MLSQILLCFSFSLNGSAVYTYSVVWRSSTSNFLTLSYFLYGVPTKRVLALGISGFCALTDIPKREEKRRRLLERHKPGVLTRARYLPAQVCITQSLSDSLSRSLSTPSLPPSVGDHRPAPSAPQGTQFSRRDSVRPRASVLAPPRSEDAPGGRRWCRGWAWGGSAAERELMREGGESRRDLRLGAAARLSRRRPAPPPAPCRRPPGAAPAAPGPGRGRGAPSLAVPGRAMGFDPSRFAGPVAAELQCGLCGRVLEEPLSTPCGHVFCAGCLLPWAARRRRCPLRCRPLAAAELRPVLPLRSLVQELEVKCDYSPRGCGRTVRLRELPAHLAACRYGPPGPAEPQPPAGHPSGRSPGSAAGQPRAGGGHRCLRALRGGGAPEPGQELKREALRWSRREKSLLAQLSALQSEVQHTARRYQAKFGQYMSHISSIARDLAGGQPGKVSAAAGIGGAARPGPRPSSCALLQPAFAFPFPVPELWTTGRVNYGAVCALGAGSHHHSSSGPSPILPSIPRAMRAVPRLFRGDIDAGPCCQMKSFIFTDFFVTPPLGTRFLPVPLWWPEPRAAVSPAVLGRGCDRAFAWSKRMGKGREGRWFRCWTGSWQTGPGSCDQGVHIRPLRLAGTQLLLLPVLLQLVLAAAQGRGAGF